MVKLTIDDKQVEVVEGTTVLQAAEQAEVYIPTLCSHPQLTPYGGCRLCMVEVEGARILQPSCTLPVTEGMVVNTKTQKVLDARKFVLTLIFSERNHFCMYCQVTNGACELQNAAYDEDMTHWPLQPNWHPYEVDASHKYFVLDNNRCILCRRCVRACAELVGNFTLGFEERGANSFLVADYGVPLGESTCISCGTCVQICPTGALIDRQSAYQGMITEVEHHPSVCIECSVGCQRDILTRDNRIVRIEGDWDSDLNHGLLCDKGRFEPLDQQNERISTPLIRKNGVLKAASWDEALKEIRKNIKSDTENGGQDLAALVSTRLSVESLALFSDIFTQSKAKIIANLDETQIAGITAQVARKMGKPFESEIDVLKNTDAVFVAGTDLVAEHQVLGFFIKRQQATGTKVIVTGSASNGLLAKADVKLLENKCEFEDIFDALIAAKSNDPEFNMIAAKTGLDPQLFAATVTILSDAEKPVFVYGAELSKTGNSNAIEKLIQFSKLIGAPILGTKGNANSLAASQLNMITPFKADGIKAAFIALGDEIPTQKLTKELESIPFVSVYSAYASQLTAKANVVLPAVTWAEEGGHYINLDGHIQTKQKALEPAEGVFDTVTVFNKIAHILEIQTKADCHKRITTPIAPVEIKVP